MATKVRYGYYGITLYVLSLALFIATGVYLCVYGARSGSDFPVWMGALFLAYGVCTTAGWLLVRYVIPGSPVTAARRLVSSLALSGDEFVLDVGTGRGLYAIEVAKLLTTGRVIGIDVWEPATIPNLVHYHKWARPTRNRIENARRNAEIERVQNKIEFKNMDVNALSFEADSFDLVICAFVIGHLGRHGKSALTEIARVLKPNGRLIIFDNVRDLGYVIMSTPHLFILSYLRGKKARRLTQGNWIFMVREAGFEIQSLETGTAVITLNAEIEKSFLGQSSTGELQ